MVAKNTASEAMFGYESQWSSIPVYALPSFLFQTLLTVFFFLQVGDRERGDDDEELRLLVIQVILFSSA